MTDLDLLLTPLQLECERSRKETEMAKEMLGRMMAEFAELQDKYNEAVLMQYTSPYPYPDSLPCRGIQTQLDKLFAVEQELNEFKYLWGEMMDRYKKYKIALTEINNVALGHPYAGSTCGDIARAALNELNRS